jgi:putative FmdB family regulatory protein
MPIYEYRCEKCGHRIERIQKFSDPPLTKCDLCGGTLSKVIAPPALQFKGTGWYITDYSDKGKPPKSEGESKEKAKEKKASDSSSKSGTAAQPPEKKSSKE